MLKRPDEVADGETNIHLGNSVSSRLIEESLMSVAEFFAYQKFMHEVYSNWDIIASVLHLEAFDLSWQMEYYERFCLILTLEHLRPAVAIEIGTHSGGSLAVLSHFSEKVYSLDINPVSSEFLAGRFPNVEFVVGDSKQTLSPILESLQQDQTGPTFVLVDGDHSRSGAKADLDTILKFRPSYPMAIITHDSFNPDVRMGIIEASWSSNPHVHLVEIDLVHGSIFDRSDPPGEMWGGLALGLLLPEERRGKLEIIARHDLLFRTVHRTSPHAASRRLRSWLGRKASRVRRALLSSRS
jgi:cephalosporin hydroxylase